MVWLIPKIGKFPRDLRFTVGEKIERQGLAVLEGLIRARFARQRTPLLDAVNVDLEVLRFLPVIEALVGWCGRGSLLAVSVLEDPPSRRSGRTVVPRRQDRDLAAP